MGDELKKAIIIGAGPAGLTCAYYLLKNTDIKPIIIEQENFVGGISRTVNIDGNRMDIGGHRFFSKNQDIVKLWETLLPKQGYPAYDDKILGRDAVLTGNADPEQTDEVLLNRRRISRIFYRRRFFSYPISLSIGTLKNLGLANSFGIGLSFCRSMFFRREEKNLEDFLVNRFGARLYETFFRDYTEKVWGRKPRDIGADWGNQRIRGLSLIKAVVDFFRKSIGKGETETSLIERFSYPKFGPGQLWEKMAQEVQQSGGKIIFGKRAEKLATSKDGRIAAVFADGERIDGDLFFSSMPIADLVRALPNDALDESARTAALNLPYRDFVTVGLLVDKLRICNTTNIPTLGDIVPDCWIYIQEPQVKIGRLQIFNNWSPYMVKDPEHTVWLGLEYFCREGDELWSMDDDAMTDFAATELRTIGIIGDNAVKKSVCLRVPKAYPAYFDTYEQFPLIRRELDKITNLYCIGRNGQHRYNNMDHSMLTAIAAVNAVMGLVDKDSVWRVNADEEYHEEAKQ